MGGFGSLCFLLSGGCPSSAEGRVPVKALRQEFSCGLELVSDKAEAKQPGSHRVLGVLCLLRLGACRSHRLCHLAEGEAKLNVCLELSRVESVLPAARGGVELEEPELYRTLGKGGVEIEHVVAAGVVVLPSAAVGVLAAVPDVREVRHRGGLFAVQLLQKPSVNRPAVAAYPAAVKVQGACQQVLVACHDVGEVSQCLRCVPLGSDVNVHFMHRFP